MKKNKILFIIFFLSACSEIEKNELIIPPNFNELPEIKESENFNNNKINEINQNEIEKLKKMLQESD